MHGVERCSHSDGQKVIVFTYCVFYTALYCSLSSDTQCEDNLKEMFGGAAYPMEPDDTLDTLAVDLMDLDNAVVVQNSELDSVDRDDVDQGPLVKVCHTRCVYYTLMCVTVECVYIMHIYMHTELLSMITML